MKIPREIPLRAFIHADNLTRTEGSSIELDLFLEHDFVIPYCPILCHRDPTVGSWQVNESSNDGEIHAAWTMRLVGSDTVIQGAPCHRFSLPEKLAPLATPLVLRGDSNHLRVSIEIESAHFAGTLRQIECTLVGYVPQPGPTDEEIAAYDAVKSAVRYKNPTSLQEQLSEWKYTQRFSGLCDDQLLSLLWLVGEFAARGVHALPEGDGYPGQRRAIRALQLIRTFHDQPLTLEMVHKEMRDAAAGRVCAPGQDQ